MNARDAVLAVLREMRTQLPEGSQNPITFLRKDNPLAVRADEAIGAVAELVEAAEAVLCVYGGDDEHDDSVPCAALRAALARIGGDPEATAFTNSGDSEAQFIADGMNACPTCGGSGHADDAAAAPPSDAPGEGEQEAPHWANVPEDEWDELPRSITGLSPSPAEQGAREGFDRVVTDALTRTDGTGMFRVSYADPDSVKNEVAKRQIFSGGDSIGERLGELVDEYEYRGDGDYTPNENERALLLDFAMGLPEDEILMGLLAGPVVAGEVEAVAWEASWHGGLYRRLFQTEVGAHDFAGSPEVPQPCTIRPLVYADTAKAGES